jgi:hypothetical protein
MFAKRIDNYTTRHHQNPLKTNAQRQSQSRIPFAAMLYSHRVVNVFQHSAVRRSSRQPAGALNTEFLAPRFALLLSVSSFVRPIHNPLAGPVASGPAPLPSVGFKWLLYVNPMIVKDKMALFGQIWAQRQTHPGAQFCTISHNRGPTTGVKVCRPGRKILEARFPSSTARFGVRRLIFAPMHGPIGRPVRRVKLYNQLWR